MASMTCPHCGAPISDRAVVCMACGKNPAATAPIGLTASSSNPASRFKISWIVWLGVGLLVLMAVVVLPQSTPAAILMALSAGTLALAWPLAAHRRPLRIPSGIVWSIGLTGASIVLFFAGALAMPSAAKPNAVQVPVAALTPTAAPVAAAVAPTVAPSAVPPTAVPPTAAAKPTSPPPTVALPTTVPEPTSVPAPTADPRRAAFLSYAPKLTDTLNKSDLANKEHAAAAANVPRTMTVVQFYGLTDRTAALNGNLAREVASTNVPSEARDFHDSVFTALKAREDSMNKAKAALDKPGVANQSAYEEARKKVDATTLQAVGALFKLCGSIGIEIEDCNAQSGLTK